ncbi:MAG: orotate phosphoribosyltransferase, partial [Bacteroidota bacterium]
MNTQHAEQIAAALLRIEAVSFSPADPFTWASGLRSPVYCDNRVTLAYPDVRRLIRDGFVQLIRSAGVLPDVIVGTATAGIPHAAWVAEALDLPMAYVRSKAKAHGRENQIEGRVVAGQRAVVIEDLISTGGSSIAAAEALQAVG